MKLEVGYKQVILLSIFFTGLAVYLNIHEEKLVFNFLADHLIALLIALFVSRIIFIIYKKK